MTKSGIAMFRHRWEDRIKKDWTIKLSFDQSIQACNFHLTTHQNRPGKAASPANGETHSWDNYVLTK